MGFYSSHVIPVYAFMFGLITIGTAVGYFAADPNQKKIFLTIHTLLFFFSILLWYPNGEAINKGRLIILGGVTDNSCLSGDSIYPWLQNSNLKAYQYTQYCLTLYNRCETMSDVNGVGEQLSCYKKNGRIFADKSDCDLLTNGSSKDKCLDTFRIEEGDISECLPGGRYAQTEPETFESLGRCISGFLKVGYILFGSKEQELELNLNRCNTLMGTKHDACLAEIMVRHKDMNLCNQLSDNVPNLQRLCYLDR